MICGGIVLDPYLNYSPGSAKIIDDNGSSGSKWINDDRCGSM